MPSAYLIHTLQDILDSAWVGEDLEAVFRRRFSGFHLRERKSVFSLGCVLFLQLRRGKTSIYVYIMYHISNNTVQASIISYHIIYVRMTERMDRMILYIYIYMTHPGQSEQESCYI